MFYSKKEKILFIAAPKTGSTSVEVKLASLFPDGTRFRIECEDGRLITSNDVCSPSLGHAKAREFREALGQSNFEALRTFGFVRDPIEKLVSSYFFTRSIPLSDALRIRADHHRVLLVVKGISSILVSRALPLWLWSLFYKMRDCHSYFTDQNGAILVDYLGSTRRLSGDFLEIMKSLGFELSDEGVSRSNASVHKSPNEYWFFRRLIPLLEKRYSRDIELYQLVSNGVWRRVSGKSQDSLQ